MAGSSSDEKCALTEYFEQRVLIQLYANSGMMSTETWKCFSGYDSVNKTAV